MNFFSRLTRLFQRTQTARPVVKRRAAERLARSKALAIEALEERCTPAVGVFNGGTDDVYVTDSDAGRTHNSIVIIDDLDSMTTFIKINGGPEQQLGKSGSLLHRLTVDMGEGNDRVSFTTRGSAHAYDGDFQRFVNLGTGDDALKIDLGEKHDLGGHDVVYRVFGDTTGDDHYAVLGEAKFGLFALDVASKPETEGNDVYDVRLRTQGAAASVNVADVKGNDAFLGELASRFNAFDLAFNVIDGAGNDSYRFDLSGVSAHSVAINLDDRGGSDAYRLAVGGSESAFTLHVKDDSSAGANSLTLTQSQLLFGLEDVDLDFIGQAKNKITLGGDAQLIGASVAISYLGGAGADSVSIADGVLGLNSTSTIDVDTQGGADKVALKLDGAKGAASAAIGIGAKELLTIGLGDGNDSFSGTLKGGAWGLDATGAVKATQFSLGVSAGAGDDKLKFHAVGGKTTEIVGDAAEFFAAFDGGAGNDSIDVNVGKIAGRGGANSFTVSLDGDLGADRLKLAGELAAASPQMILIGSVLLGSDLDADSFRSTFHTAKNVALPANEFAVGQIQVGVDHVTVAPAPSGPIYLGV